MTVTDSQIVEFYSSLNIYGYSDVETAIEKFAEVKLSARDLADRILEIHESIGIPIEDLDVCFVAFDHILEMARNKIDEIVHFDIVNDIEGGGFFTVGDYMCSCFDYSQGAKAQLENKLREAKSYEIEELIENNFSRTFLEDVDIDIKEIKKQEVTN